MSLGSERTERMESLGIAIDEARESAIAAKDEVALRECLSAIERGLTRRIARNRGAQKVTPIDARQNSPLSA